MKQPPKCGPGPFSGADGAASIIGPAPETADRGASSANDSACRRRAKVLVRIAAFGSGILIVGGLIGQALRDRSVATALLMYVPLPLVGAAALILDIPRKGRSIPRFRFGLSALGLGAFAWSAHAMIGSGLVDDPRPGDREISVLHCNVQWGGGLFRGPRTWAA